MVPFKRNAVILALAIFIVDQASKWAILQLVMQPPRQIVIAPFFNLVLVHNTGISFGLFTGEDDLKRWVLIGAALAMTVALILWYRATEEPLVAYSAMLVVGGAIGNVVDRFLHPGVVDFLDFHLAGYHWPAFNVADAAIVIGAALLAYDSLFGARAAAK
ncbi:MAG: signal peptidase II [Alphaproteobacteria bacterium]